MSGLVIQPLFLGPLPYPCHTGDGVEVGYAVVVYQVPGVVSGGGLTEVAAIDGAVYLHPPLRIPDY